MAVPCEQSVETSSAPHRLERFAYKCIRSHAKESRPNMNLERRSDSIGTQKALVTRFSNLILGLTGLILVSACASTSGYSGASRGANYAAGSPLGVSLPRSEHRALEPLFLQAVSRGTAGERYDWRGKESFGWVKAGAAVLGNVKSSRNDRPPYPAELTLADKLETELGLYAVTRNANVRSGPSTDYPIMETLTAGDGVIAVGRVVGKRWFLVEKDGIVRGYIFDSLLRKAPGSELELAGGPTRKPLRCRNFEQRLSYNGRSDRWAGVACLERGVWVLQQPSENAPQYLY
ncbi:MAG: SH3 domain-containing protein [Pseudomonadota bacterium]